MRLIIAILALGLTTTDALAAESTCKAQATDKKLAGAALTSFMKKCEGDAKNADSGGLRLPWAERLR